MYYYYDLLQYPIFSSRLSQLSQPSLKTSYSLWKRLMKEDGGDELLSSTTNSRQDIGPRIAT